MNKVRIEELTSIMQYLQHHYIAKGINSPSVGALFKGLSIIEMKHADELRKLLED